jgi:hypothetical protein
LRQAVVSLVWALRSAARGASAERRGFLSTSLPSAHAVGSIISPCGLLCPERHAEARTPSFLLLFLPEELAPLWQRADSVDALSNQPDSIQPNDNVHQYRAHLPGVQLWAMAKSATCASRCAGRVADGRQCCETETTWQEVVQCPSSLFLSFRKYARMRHHLLIK